MNDIILPDQLFHLLLHFSFFREFLYLLVEAGRIAPGDYGRLQKTISGAF